jgi:hypothetical protein
LTRISGSTAGYQMTGIGPVGSSEEAIQSQSAVLLKIRRQQEAIEKPGRISADGDATRQDVTALVSVTSESVYGPLMDQLTKWLTAAQSTG